MLTLIHSSVSQPRLLGPVTAVVLIAWLAPASSARADEAEAFEFGGLLFGDIYTIPSHHTEEGEDASGVVIRRVYLTADFDVGEEWWGRARIEINQDGEFESYDFEAEFKDLYLARNFGAHEWIFGLSPTLTFDLIESIWDARYLMRTPMDLQGVASRDTGIAVRGPIGDSQFSYRVMGGTGAEFGAEAGDGRKWMAALNWTSKSGIEVDLYTDFEKLAGPSDRTTAQVFVGRKSETLRWGAQYSYQDREDDPRLELASAFIVKSVTDNMSVIGRVDRIIEPSPKGDNISYIPFDASAPATMFLSGVEYRFNEKFRLTPNVIWTTYDRNAEGERPTDDLHLRLTLFLDLE